MPGWAALLPPRDQTMESRLPSSDRSIKELAARIRAVGHIRGARRDRVGHLGVGQQLRPRVLRQDGVGEGLSGAWPWRDSPSCRSGARRGSRPSGRRCRRAERSHTGSTLVDKPAGMSDRRCPPRRCSRRHQAVEQVFARGVGNCGHRRGRLIAIDDAVAVQVLIQGDGHVRQRGVAGGEIAITVAVDEDLIADGAGDEPVVAEVLRGSAGEVQTPGAGLPRPRRRPQNRCQSRNGRRDPGRSARCPPGSSGRWPGR